LKSSPPLDGYGFESERSTRITIAEDAMRAARTGALLIGIAALASCNKPAQDQNVAMDINSASPSDIETLPSDESSETPSNELVNGTDNPEVNDLNASSNSF
jgi:hypothetical protein